MARVAAIFLLSSAITFVSVAEGVPGGPCGDLLAEGLRLVELRRLAATGIRANLRFPQIDVGIQNELLALYFDSSLTTEDFSRPPAATEVELFAKAMNRVHRQLGIRFQFSSELPGNRSDRTSGEVPRARIENLIAGERHQAMARLRSAALTLDDAYRSHFPPEDTFHNELFWVNRQTRFLLDRIFSAPTPRTVRLASNLRRFGSALVTAHEGPALRAISDDYLRHLGSPEARNGEARRRLASEARERIQRVYEEEFQKAFPEDGRLASKLADQISSN